MIKTLPLYKTQSVDCQAVQQAFDEANFSLAAKDPQLEKALEKHWPDLERTLISQAYCMRVDTQQGNTYGTYIASLTQPHIDEEVVTVLRVYCEELNYAGLCERSHPCGDFFLSTHDRQGHTLPSDDPQAPFYLDTISQEIADTYPGVLLFCLEATQNDNPADTDISALVVGEGTLRRFPFIRSTGIHLVGLPSRLFSHPRTPSPPSQKNEHLA